MTAIISRYIAKEVLTSSLAVLVVLLIILIGNTALKVLSKVVEGRVSSELLWQLLAINFAHYLVVLLPLSFYLGILLALGRMYKDSEMTAMQACGTGPGYQFRAVALIVIPVVLITATLALLIAPYTSQLRDELRTLAANQPLLSTLASGQFNQIDDLGAAIFIEAFDEGRAVMQSVFLQQQDAESVSVQVARSGTQIIDNDGYRYLQMDQGFAVHLDKKTQALRTTVFEQQQIRLNDTPIDQRRLRISSTPSIQLWQQRQDPKAAAELQWRFAIPIMTLVLSMLAVPLSMMRPRQGRYAKLGWGILAYIIYSNLLSVIRSSMEKGQWPADIGLWAFHLAAIGFLVYFCLQKGFIQLATVTIKRA